MNYIRMSSLILATASKGNPVITTLVVIIFWFLFNQLEAMIETLIFGHRFEHWLDPIVASAFIAYAAHSVYSCAVYVVKQEEKQD